MTYERFEDLPVWKSAIDLGVASRRLVKNRGFTGPGDLSDQLCRASLSVSNNIAEGFERGTTAELLSYLYIARGSAGEVRSMLCFCELTGDFNDLKSQISDLKSLAESCSRQLRSWAGSLQDSPIEGQRRLNAHSRARYDRAKRVRAFDEKLRRMVDEARRKNDQKETEI